MPIDPRELDPYAAREVYEHDFKCRRCGYNLRGLVRGCKCPECGFQQRKGTILEARDNLLYAPLGYLRTLRAGAALMAVGVVVAAVLAAATPFPVPDRLRVGVRLVGAAVWLAGVWITTAPRQVSPRTPANPREEWKTTRWLNRALQACWLLSALAALSALGSGAGGGGGASMLVLGEVFYVLALIGLVPLAIQIADLAEWGADSGLASRLRGAAWGLTVFGAVVYMGGFFPRLLGPFGFFLLVPLLVCGGLWVISLLVFGYSVVQLASMTHWAIINSEHLAARDQRVAERAQRDQRAAEAGVYRSAAGLRLEQEAAGACPQCGYSLVGLPPNAPCPECGHELSPMPVRKAPPEVKPAWMLDDSPIPLEPEKPRKAGK